jgi:alanine racemase
VVNSVNYPAWAEVDLETIVNNVKSIPKLVGQKPAILGVVKANAYGHGLLPCALAMLQGGVTYLGVAQVSEAIALRQAGITNKMAKILTWLYSSNAPFDRIINLDIEISVGSFWQLEKIVQTVKKLPSKTKAKIHLKMDIEFGRDGFNPEQYDNCFKTVLKHIAFLEVKGLWTHFAMADIPENIANKKHLQAYNLFVNKYIDYFGDSNLPLRHIANSAICLTRPELAFDMVRPGILAYGLKTIDSIDINKLGFVPAMSLMAYFSTIREYQDGQGVSYGHKYKPTKATKIGVVPLGYADGIRWTKNNYLKTYSFTRDDLINSVGAICMDQTLYDLGSNALEQPGDKVEFFGVGESLVNRQKLKMPSYLTNEAKNNFETKNIKRLTADDVANMVGTIGYDIVTSVGQRIPRIYKNKAILGSYEKLLK